MGAHIATDVSDAEAARLVARVPRWHQAMEVVPGVHAPGADDPLPLLRRLGLTPRMDGLRALEVGCRDGFFAFEMERRGAGVTVVHRGGPTEGFLLARRLRRSRVVSVPGDVYDLVAQDTGPFDVVLLLGVLDRLRHPLLALDVLGDLVRPGGTLLVETAAIDQGLVGPDGREYAMGEQGLPLMQFLPLRERPGGERCWAPSLACLESMIGSAPFRIRGASIWTPGRALVRAVRLHPADEAAEGFPGPPDLLGRRATARPLPTP